MTQITKTQVFSQIVDQKEHKNNWYKFGGSTSRFQHHPTVHTVLNPSKYSILSCWKGFYPNIFEIGPKIGGSGCNKSWALSPIRAPTHRITTACNLTISFGGKGSGFKYFSYLSMNLDGLSSHSPNPPYGPLKSRTTWSSPERGETDFKYLSSWNLGEPQSHKTEYWAAGRFRWLEMKSLKCFSFLRGCVNYQSSTTWYWIWGSVLALSPPHHTLFSKCSF